ncbi:hypothetical protein UCRNP2_7454 [Neofusicoccum parvum UCRNP2]|uniref:Protein kinase domain-containing protein n=1 Tax=Botryosphaeria parva (strain UCR-NP2) TaxID=1287680 RepID=R1GC68_BOTPV|nr:hypothetical protein UCRNP2_7454 [Neofusicoccum parvum UCRNP2]
MLQQRVRASLTEGPLERPTLLIHSSNSSDDSEDNGVIDFEPLYTDFSAAIPTHAFPSPSPSDPSSPPSSPRNAATGPPPHLAGGTWDFLAPELCRLHPAPALPSPASDVYALGVALLVLALGESPFDGLAAGNAFRKREMVKTGDAVGFAKAPPIPIDD